MVTPGQDHQHHDPDLVMDEAFWDERYRSANALWSGRPNPQLLAEAASLAPGRALDVGCGEGADAIWLAERGWLVTAVDISTVALARGAARAAEVGVGQRITWVHTDLSGWIPEDAIFDLVSAQFMQLPAEQRDSLFRRLSRSVAPDGSLLVVGHDFCDLQTTAGRPSRPELFFTASDVAASLDRDEWRIVVSEVRPRAVTDPDGHPITVRDAVVRAERR